MAMTSESAAVSSLPASMPTSNASAAKSIPTNQADLAAAFTSFLSVSIHQILFLRSVYPRVTFLPVRAYNYPVRQSRHPKVCDYINDVTLAVENEVLKGTITAVTVILSSIRTNQPMERYAFDLSGFPHVTGADVYTTFAERSQDRSRTPLTAQTVDLEAQFRACLARLASACARLTPLPQDDEFGFTVCIEVREDALPPAGTTRDEQAWIVAEPGQVHLRSCHAPCSVSKTSNEKQGSSCLLSSQTSKGRAKTVPVRRIEAGELRLELWVEEAKQKFDEPSLS